MFRRPPSRAFSVVVWAAFAGLAGNGVWMMLAPARWYALVPGIAATGPFNGHMARDIGAVYLAVALAFALVLRGAPGARGAMTVAATWLSLHALTHVAELLDGHAHGNGSTVSMELAGVYFPALLAVLLAFGMPGRRVARGPVVRSR